jgi:AraC family transcriptional regulator
MPSLVVDFVKEKEEGYKRIFSRSPLLSSVSTHWDGILVAYDYLEPGQTPEISVKQLSAIASMFVSTMSLKR